MKKEIWRISWLESIHELTSFKLQKNSSVDMTNGSSFWRFDNLVNQYIDKVLFGFDFQYYTDKINHLSPEEYEIIKDWHNELEDYIILIGDDSDDAVNLRDQLVNSFLHTGKRTKQKLIAILPESEKRYLK